MKFTFSEHEKRAMKTKVGLWAGVTPEQMPQWRNRQDKAK
jgi:endonuclease YncB( thermonuclease family)